jgi:hypothetical protein
MMFVKAMTETMNLCMMNYRSLWMEKLNAMDVAVAAAIIVVGLHKTPPSLCCKLAIRWSIAGPFPVVHCAVAIMVPLMKNCAAVSPRESGEADPGEINNLNHILPLII